MDGNLGFADRSHAVDPIGGSRCPEVPLEEGTRRCGDVESDRVEKSFRDEKQQCTLQRMLRTLAYTTWKAVVASLSAVARTAVVLLTFPCIFEKGVPTAL